MKKWLVLPLSILLILAFMVGCTQQAATPAPPKSTAPAAPTSAAPASSSAAAANAPITLKYGHDLPPSAAPAAGLTYFAAEVTKQTQGRVKVDLYPSSTLATQADGLEAVRTGVADIYYVSIGSHRKDFPLTVITGLPGIGFPDDTLEANKAHAATFWDMLNKYPAALAEYKEFAPPFFYIIYSESYLCLKSKLVKVPTDLKGLKVGSTGSKMDLMNKMGAAGVTDVPPTAYEKMQTGVEDAAFAAISAVHDFKIFEVSKYILDVPFGASGMIQLFNKKAWDKVSPADQKLIMTIAAQASEVSSKSIAEANAAAWKEVEGMGKRVSVTKDERALWDKEFTFLWDDYVKTNDSVGNKNSMDMITWWKAASDKVWAAQTK
jgi:TRAP-type transport system periplasmic protein